MSSTVLNPSRNMPLPRAIELPATSLEKLMVFMAGLMLPAISFSRGSASASGILGRATPVDFIVCAAILTIVARGRRIQWDGPALAFGIVLVISLGKGLTMAHSKEEFLLPVTAFIALAMAMAYWVLGASIARSRDLVRALLFGAMCGVAWEGFIVVHDYLMPGSKWFIDRAEMRVRGTFRKSGQLAAYGFSITGLLLSFGWLFWKSPFSRLFGLMTAGLGPLFVLAASRRSGMAALAIWLAAYLVIGMRHAPRWVYAWLIVGVVVGGLGIALNWSKFEGTYAGQRVLGAFQSVEQGSSFTQLQFASAMENFTAWFPFGTGVGMGHTAVGVVETSAKVDAVAEIHNGHLAIVVELGVLGGLAFGWMVTRAMFRQWNDAIGPGTKITRVVVMTFVMAAMVFALHNRVHRDRGFMLLLGLACHASWPAAGRAGAQRWYPGIAPPIRRIAAR